MKKHAWGQGLPWKRILKILILRSEKYESFKCSQENSNDSVWLEWKVMASKHTHSDYFMFTIYYNGFPGGSDSKESACNAGDPGSIPGLGRSPGEGTGNPLQYSCLQNPLDRGGWRATVHWLQRVRQDWVINTYCVSVQLLSHVWLFATQMDDHRPKPAVVCIMEAHSTWVAF